MMQAVPMLEKEFEDFKQFWRQSDARKPTGNGRGQRNVHNDLEHSLNKAIEDAIPGCGEKWAIGFHVGLSSAVPPHPLRHVPRELRLRAELSRKHPSQDGGYIVVLPRGLLLVGAVRAPQEGWQGEVYADLVRTCLQLARWRGPQ